ncbi:conjugal transfer protein (plasmid) [Nocardiopsis exhalans]|uniref:Conjugal transfer protein n=1 Tax=Nocardiopsis exhalans TaxID=163604 RepID=A0ABY5DJW3_9ACTN|nr:conjugal transfer protein [Nocardiopsis exhalans]USY23540.1 conjugal transfer protein [Nocardiopsis exhalans]
MDLPTYTNIWRIEKRLYKLYDFRLPMPVPVTTGTIFIASMAGWWLLLALLRVPFDFGNGWHLVLWVVPPGVLAVLVTRPVAEAKRLGELLVSQARFMTEARVYVRMRPEYEPAHVHIQATVWHQGTAPDRRTATGRPTRRLRTVTIPRALAPAPRTTAAAPTPVPAHAA